MRLDHQQRNPAAPGMPGSTEGATGWNPNTVTVQGHSTRPAVSAPALALLSLSRRLGLAASRATLVRDWTGPLCGVGYCGLWKSCGARIRPAVRQRTEDRANCFSRFSDFSSCRAGNRILDTRPGLYPATVRPNSPPARNECGTDCGTLGPHAQIKSAKSMH